MIRVRGACLLGLHALPPLLAELFQHALQRTGGGAVEGDRAVQTLADGVAERLHPLAGGGHAAVQHADALDLALQEPGAHVGSDPVEVAPVAGAVTRSAIPAFSRRRAFREMLPL